MSNTDYNALAPAYVRGRRAIGTVVDELGQTAELSAQSNVLEVGCGTGNHISALVDRIGCQGWGIEPSDGMRQHAEANPLLRLLAGSAESLPIDTQRFNLVYSVDVIHHVQHKPNYFAEAFRVLKSGGQLCTVTESEDMIEGRNPQSVYFYGSAIAERQRYPKIEELKQLMVAAGFVDIVERETHQLDVVTDATPYREKAFSSLLFMNEDDFRAGLARLEADLKTGPIHGHIKRLCLWGRIP